MIHYMNLNPIPFKMIADQTKTIELRLNDENRQKINKDDEIIFTNTENNSLTLRVKVKEKYIFPNFEELYKSLPLNKFGYKKDEKAHFSDMNIYYSVERQALCGVVGIEIVLFK